MTVTVTSLGTNTTQITMSGETGLSNFITALDTAITSQGWSQLDVSNQYYRVYQSLNLDGTTYKNIAIQIDPTNFRMYTTSWQSWNSSTHAGTNEVWTWNRSGMMGLATSNCDVIVMASSRWCVLQTFIRNQGSPWSGVFELMREANEDTATANYPCWCWTTSAIIFACPSIVPTIAGTVSLPMTRGGLTGQAASINNSLMTPLFRLGATSATPPAYLGTNLPGLETYSWNTSKRMVQSARVVVNGTELHGRILGLKLTYNIGSQFNVASLTVDSNFNYSSTGTATNHWVLQGNPTTSTSNVFNTTASGTGYVTINSISLASVTSAVLVNTGMYACTETATTTGGVYYVDLSGSTPGSPTAISGITGSCWQIIYDGVQYVYVATSSGIYQINTTNSNSVVQLTGTSALACRWLCWDGTYVWFVSSANASPIYQYNVSSSTLTTYTPSGQGAYAACDICCDNSGNVYMLNADGIVYKCTASGTITLYYTAPFVSNYGGGLYFNGENLIVAMTNSTNQGQYLYPITLGSTTGVSTGYSQGINLTNNCSSNAYLRTGMAKIGVYDAVASYTNTDDAFLSTQLSGTATPSNASYNYFAISQSMNAVWSDGNRAIITMPSAGLIYYITNLYHPDETTNTYGRFLLPQ